MMHLLIHHVGVRNAPCQRPRNMQTPLAKIKYESYVSLVLLLPRIHLTTVDEMSSNTTIYATSIAVRDALLKYNATSNMEHKEWAEDMLADFNIWAYDSGACIKGMNSLDSRITISIHVREVVVNMLSMLNNIVARLQAQGKWPVKRQRVFVI